MRSDAYIGTEVNEQLEVPNGTAVVGPDVLEASARHSNDTDTASPALRTNAKAPSVRPSVSQLISELPNFRQKAEPECFEGDGEARVGCTEKCKCHWFERCYPKLVLWQGRGRSQAGVESIDIGACNLSVTMLVLLSVVIFCLFMAVIFAVRGALFIFAFMTDKSKMDMMKQKRPIRISTSYPVSDDLVPDLPERDAHSAA